MSIRRLVLVLLGAAVVLACPGPSRLAASQVRDKLQGAAREIARLVKDKKQTEVAIKAFAGPPKASAGPMLQAVLIEELKKAKVGINATASLCVEGEYFILEDEKKSEELMVRLIFAVRNKKGKRLPELVYDVDYRGNVDLVKLLAMNADLEKLTKADRQTRNERLKQQLEKPPLFIDGTRVKVSRTSSFAVEVLDRPKGGDALKVLPPKANKDQAFVALKKGQEYGLKLHNNSKYDAAVSITIDGVDAFGFFEPAARRPAAFLIPPGQTRVVKGWQRGAEKVSLFQPGSFGDSAVGKTLKGNPRLGTITVCFHHCWERDRRPPEYQGSASADPPGPPIWPIGERARAVRRTIGPLVAAVSVRYNK